MVPAPAISVIVPVYNVEAYVRKCLDSLLKQTLPEIEIIAVNDGSTDNSGTILDEIAGQIPDKVKVLHKSNGGLSDARNAGIDIAKGEFLAFVDSDDYVSPKMLEEMYHLAKTNRAQIVVCNLQKVDETGAVTQKLEQLHGYPECIQLAEMPQFFADIGYFACNKIFDRCLFAQHRFRKGVHFEDIELIPKLFLASHTIAQTSSYHYNYFERANSISKTHTEKGLDILRAVEGVTAAYKNSPLAPHTGALRNFQILQGIYSFLAYAAFIKDEQVAQRFRQEFKRFRQRYGISLWQILTYRRFNKNYLVSLPLKKQLFYAAYFLGVEPPTLHRFLSSA